MRVNDFDVALRFYVEGLGFVQGTIRGEGDALKVMLDTGNASYVELVAGGSPQVDEGRLRHFGILTINCASSLARALAAGASLVKEPMTLGRGAQVAFCRGPSGELIEFVQEFRADS